MANGQVDACSTNVDAGLERVGAWVNRVWRQGSKDRSVAFQVWVNGTQDAACAQRRGTSGKKRSPSPTPSHLYLLDLVR